MKNLTFLLISILIIVLCMCSCNQTSVQEYSITINNDIKSSELDSLDVERAAVAPMYIPQQMDGNSINCGYYKSGLDAYIYVDNETIVKFAFIELQNDSDKIRFPSVGEARIIEGLDYARIYYRLSKENGCIVTSETVTVDVLEKILNSFTIRKMNAD